MIFSFYRQLAEALECGAVVVATVVQIRGSVPREVGAKLFVDAEGNVIGTVGGGAGEAKVIRQAKTVLATGEKQFVTIDLSGASDRETQGVCGGRMQVWLERWQDEAASSLVQQILVCLETGQLVMLVTPFAPERSPYLEKPGVRSQESEVRLRRGFDDELSRIERSAERSQTAEGQGTEIVNLASSQPQVFSRSFPQFTEILQPPPTLLIVGAGHCGIQLAKVADLIGFQVMVQDDRPEWASASHYPQVSKIFAGSIADAVNQLAQHTQLYAALVTRGYLYDQEALTLLLQREIPCAYIGMIGSQKRVRQVFQAVEQTGMAPEKLHHVHAPIGLDIGALTPEEIAVSISAELILVRRGGTGRPLSQI